MRCPWTVGRAAEQSVLGEALAAAAAGRGGAVFLLGEAGIGKSRLAAGAWLRAKSVHGMAQLVGRCVATAPATPLRPFAEALCAAVRTYGEPRGAGLGPFRGVLGRLVPEWRVPASSGQGPDLSLVALAEGILRFLRAVGSGNGALLLLDDLHWADPETLAVVEYLADNVAAERVLLVAAAREEPAAAATLAGALRSRAAAEVVRVPRLSARHLPDLVRGCLGGVPGRGPAVPDDVVAVAARAGGHPYLVEELLAGAVATGVIVADGASWRLAAPYPAVVPGAVAADVAGRLAALRPAARAVVPAAAVLGDVFDWTLLPEVAGLDEADVLTGLREAVAAQLLAPDRRLPGEAFRFRHGLTRDAVLADLLPPERAALARRALAVLDERDAEPDPDLRTRLALDAGDTARAAALLVRTGIRATATGALATAEAALRRALELEPAAPGGAAALVDALSLAGRWAEAEAAGSAALARPGASPGARRAAPRPCPRRRHRRRLGRRAAPLRRRARRRRGHARRAPGRRARRRRGGPRGAGRRRPRGRGPAGPAGAGRGRGDRPARGRLRGAGGARPQRAVARPRGGGGGVPAGPGRRDAGGAGGVARAGPARARHHRPARTRRRRAPRGGP